MKLEEEEQEEEQEQEVEETPSFKITGIEELKVFQQALKDCVTASKIVFSAGKDIVTTEGASLIVAGAPIDNGVLKRLASRMDDGLLNTIFIRQDGAFIKAVKELLKFNYLNFIRTKEEDNDLVYQLILEDIQQIPKHIDSINIDPALFEELLLLMIKKQKTLFFHLLSSSLFCLGLSLKHPAFERQGLEEKQETAVAALLTGLFSDIAIPPDEYMPDNDKGVLHAMQSADLVEQAGFPAEVVEAIRLSHLFESKEKIPFDKYLAHFIALSEYFHFYLFEKTQGKKNEVESDYLEQFFFDQGYIESLKLFDEFSVDILATLFENYQSSQEDGRMISEVVECCVYPDKKGSSAVPYPLSRSVTQILCRNNKTECALYDKIAGTIFFAKPTVQGNILTSISLPAGTYGKCTLEDKLPAKLKEME